MVIELGSCSVRAGMLESSRELFKLAEFQLQKNFNKINKIDNDMKTKLRKLIVLLKPLCQPSSFQTLWQQISQTNAKFLDLKP